MGTMFDADDRASLLKRLKSLGADRAPLWGKMNCPKMLAHLSDALRMTFGDLHIPGKWTPMRHFPAKHLIIYVLPFPKGVPTAPELIARSPEAAEEFEKELKDLARLIDRFADEEDRDSWPDHPVFGSMSPRAWGVLAYRHIDHHLRQFEV